MEAQNLLDLAGDDDVASCCSHCNEGRANAFKAGLPTKRVRIQIAPSDTRSKQDWVRYQTDKCGPLEYNILDPSWYMSAFQHIGYELDPRNAVWADGLAATPPPAAPSSYKFGCCLLEAKYSQSDRGLALYVGRRTFVNTRNRKWWLRAAYQRYRDGKILQNFLARRFGRRSRPIRTFQRFAGDKWLSARARAVAQLAAYSVFCRSPETPFTIFVVIVGEMPFVRNYFRPITPYPGLVAHARLNGPNWRT